MDVLGDASLINKTHATIDSKNSQSNIVVILLLSPFFPRKKGFHKVPLKLLGEPAFITSGNAVTIGNF